MMDEYISKTKFEELMRKAAKDNFDLYYYEKSKHRHDSAKHYYNNAIGCNMAADEAYDFPSADVQLVKHGRWIEQKHTPTNGYNYNVPYSTYICSSCGLEIHNDEYSKYIRGIYTNCPVCTARMDGDIGMKMESREEILSRDFSTDMESRNCGDCKHYFYFVGEAGCELDSTSYPELCENFTPDDESKEFVSKNDGVDDSSRCCYSGVECYADDCATCKERIEYFKEDIK